MSTPHHTDRPRWRTTVRAAVAVLVAVITLMGMVTPANASNHRVEVSGVAVPANPGDCDPNADLALIMSGDLEGCSID